MSEDRFSIRRAGGPGRIAQTPTQPEAVEAPVGVSRVAASQLERAGNVPSVVETAEALPSELGGSVDLRLFERMNPVLVSPAISSMTHRANVLHSVVSWLDAQKERLAGVEGGDAADTGNHLPWLGSVIDTLREEIVLIESFHRGVVRDVESPVE